MILYRFKVSHGRFVTVNVEEVNAIIEDENGNGTVMLRGGQNISIQSEFIQNLILEMRKT